MNRNVLIALALFGAGIADAAAADPKQVEAAVKRGADFLAQRFRNDAPNTAEGIGPTALAGLALHESGKPVDDPAVRAVTAAVRDAAFSETRTYQIALCLLYLDRLGDKVDDPAIQMLAVRLLAGQTA